MNPSTVLWVSWVLGFAVLEYQGLKDPTDSRFTLTNRVRAIMKTSPAARIAARGAITVGLSWLAYHFLVVDPTINPGAWVVAFR